MLLIITPFSSEEKMNKGKQFLRNKEGFAKAIPFPLVIFSYAIDWIMDIVCPATSTLLYTSRKWAGWVSEWTVQWLEKASKAPNARTT